MYAATSRGMKSAVSPRGATDRQMLLMPEALDAENNGMGQASPRTDEENGAPNQSRASKVRKSKENKNLSGRKQEVEVTRLF